MAKVADTYLIYQVLKRLTTPFDQTDAYELGLIDKNGKLLKKPKTPKLSDCLLLSFILFSPGLARSRPSVI